MFSHSDLDDENNFYRKICEYIGVYYKDAPFIVYYGERKQKHVCINDLPMYACCCCVCGQLLLEYPTRTE